MPCKSNGKIKRLKTAPIFADRPAGESRRRVLGGCLFGRLLLHLLPILDVVFGKLATAFAFAGVLKFTLVLAGLAATQALAVIHAGAIVDFGQLFGGSDFAGCGIGVGGGIRAIRVALAHDCAAEQTGHSRRNQDFSGGVPHKNDDFDPEHLWHIAGGMLKRK
jgi:hypothetical protein